MVTTPATASELLLPLSQRCAVATSPRKRPGVGLCMWDDPHRPLAQPHLMPRSGLPPAAAFPMLHASLVCPQVTPGNSSGIHAGVGCSLSPATGVAPPLSEGRSWAEKKGVE